MSRINVDTSELIAYKNRLEKMGRSDFPVAVRQSVNEVAFFMKSKTLPAVFVRTFINRRDFLPKFTYVNKSPNTFDINQMVSETGISDRKKIGERLALQEHGGTIANRNVPMDSTRGGDRQSKQLATYYFKKFKKLPNGHHKSQKGVKVSRRPQTTYIKTDDRVYAVHRGGKWETMYKKEGSVRLRRKPFIQPAGEEAYLKMNQFFVQFAKKRLSK